MLLSKSIFLYNRELWTVASKITNSIDVTQRNFLHQILGIKWTVKVKNEDIYQQTKTCPWSEWVKFKRVKWLGHLLQLPSDTPAKLALEEALQPTKCFPRCQPTMWLTNILDDLHCIGIEDLEDGRPWTWQIVLCYTWKYIFSDYGLAKSLWRFWLSRCHVCLWVPAIRQ